MPASGIKLVDANVWLALAFSDHVHHDVASRWFDAQSDATCAFCRLTQLALLRNLTNSKVMGKFVQSQQQAWQAYDQLNNDPRSLFMSEPPNLETEFRSLTQSTSSLHHRWTDSFLAALSQLTSSQLVTFDKGFASYPGLDLLLLA